MNSSEKPRTFKIVARVQTLACRVVAQILRNLVVSTCDPLTLLGFLPRRAFTSASEVFPIGTKFV